MAAMEVTPKKLITALVLAGLGLGVATLGGDAANKAQGYVKWPSVAGNIESGEITKDDKTGSWVPIVFYRYRVKGKMYTSYAVSVKKPMYGSEKAAQAIVDKFPVGTECPVYYNPANPESAVLRRGSSSWASMAKGIGALMLLGGVITIFIPSKESSHGGGRKGQSQRQSAVGGRGGKSSRNAAVSSRKSAKSSRRARRK